MNFDKQKYQKVFIEILRLFNQNNISLKERLTIVGGLIISTMMICKISENELKKLLELVNNTYSEIEKK